MGCQWSFGTRHRQFLMPMHPREGTWQKAPSNAHLPRCWGGMVSAPRVAHRTLCILSGITSGPDVGVVNLLTQDSEEGALRSRCRTLTRFNARCRAVSRTTSLVAATPASSPAPVRPAFCNASNNWLWEALTAQLLCSKRAVSVKCAARDSFTTRLSGAGSNRREFRPPFRLRSGGGLRPCPGREPSR